MNLKGCKRFKAKGYQDTLNVKQSVKKGLKLHFEGIDERDIDKVLNTMCNSFNVCSILVQKAKKDPGGGL